MPNLKVNSLYLEGFAKIHTGMHIDRLYLDFDSMPNMTYLFVGDSGSGKSSTLKSIHPFAFNSSTGDETSNGDLIMLGRDGRKIIEYNLDGDIIKCTHLYLRKSDGGIQVKSYFSFNDEELNPSGLVSTFKELVYKYFYIDESFLTLLALGNSVRSMVEYTSGERKKLSVKIFTELNIYMTYYKNASAVVKDLKSVLNNVVDKLSKYANYDKKELKKSEKELVGKIDKLQNELDELLKGEGAISAQINSTIEDYKKYEESQGMVTGLLTKVEELKRKRKTNKDSAVLENDKLSINGNLINAELRKESLENNIKSELNFKEIKIASKSHLEDSMNRIVTDKDRIELEKLLANISRELIELNDIEINDKIDYKVKKDELIKANIYLDELKSMSVDLVSEVSMIELIPDAVSKYIKDKDFGSKLDITYQAILEKINNIRVSNQIGEEIKIPEINHKCDTKDCPYIKFYKELYDLSHYKKEKLNNLIREEEEKKRTTEQLIIIRRIVKRLYEYIDNHTDVLQSVPKDIFNPATFINTFLSSSDREVYDRDLMGSMLRYLEQASRKMELLVLKSTTENQISGIDETNQLYESFKKDLERINQTILETDETLSIHQKDLEYNKNLIKEYTEAIREVESEILIAKDIENTRKQIQEVQKQLQSMESLKIEHDKLNSQYRGLKEQESILRDDINSYRIQLGTIKNTLETMDSLEKEKIILAEKYNRAVLIKDAVSPSKGIPVEFIDDVIRNQMIDSINELMHVAYPDITLLKDPEYLVINDKEFTIPYKKNGVIIGDISEASDGERAMLSLAFSLVLIRLVSKVYNIMLLDEMDTALDKYGRSKYIDIIEQYMSTINASQIFLISHNSMFDMYGVNVLQTTNNVTNTNDATIVVPVYECNFTPDKYK